MSLLHPWVVQAVNVCVHIMCGTDTNVFVTQCCWRCRAVEGPDCALKRELEFPGVQRRESERLGALLNRNSPVKGHRPTLCVRASPAAMEHVWTGREGQLQRVQLWTSWAQHETNTLLTSISLESYRQPFYHWKSGLPLASLFFTILQLIDCYFYKLSKNSEQSPSYVVGGCTRRIMTILPVKRLKWSIDDLIISVYLLCDYLTLQWHYRHYSSGASE